MAVSTQDKQQLQEKLQQLQMKKHRMDQLLDELQALKIERDIHNNGLLMALAFPRTFSSLTLLVGLQEGHPACKNRLVRYCNVM